MSHVGVPKKYRSVQTVVVHGNCADGLASAMLLHDALPDARIEFVQYGTEAHTNLKAGPNILFCDLTPPRERVQEFVDAGAMVLDHHKHAQDIVEAFGDNGVFADEKEEPGVAGATLAWREVWKPTFSELQGCEIHYHMMPDGRCTCGLVSNAEEFATLAGIYDTWQTQDDRWHKARVQTEVLKFFPDEIWMSKTRPFLNDSDTRQWWASKLEFGELLIQKHETKVKGTVRGSYQFKTEKGTRVMVFEGASLASIAAEIVDQAADLIVGFNYKVENEKGTFIVSTRSHTGYDCGSFCKHYGGGGHTAAAAFSHEFRIGYPDVMGQGSNPYDTVRSFIERYEYGS